MSQRWLHVKHDIHQQHTTTRGDTPAKAKPPQEAEADPRGGDPYAQDARPRVPLPAPHTTSPRVPLLVHHTTSDPPTASCTAHGFSRAPLHAPRTASPAYRFSPSTRLTDSPAASHPPLGFLIRAPLLALHTFPIYAPLFAEHTTSQLARRCLIDRLPAAPLITRRPLPPPASSHPRAVLALATAFPFHAGFPLRAALPASLLVPSPHSVIALR